MNSQVSGIQMGKACGWRREEEGESREVTVGGVRGGAR